MSRTARTAVAAVSLAGLLALLAWAASGLPHVGDPPGVNAVRVPQLLVGERAVANTVNGVTYDMRAADTLGEELILFSSALGVSLLLRTGERRKREPAGRRRAVTSSALRVAGAVLVAPLVVLGCYLVAHGQLSPGGGFQGGALLGAVLLLVYAAGQSLAGRRIEPTPVAEIVDAVGALAFALVAIGGLVFAGALLANFLGVGTLGALLSGGTVPLLSVATGIEVAGATGLIVLEFVGRTW